MLTEILDVTPAVAEAVTTTTTAAELRTEATRRGALESLEKDALWHMTEGYPAVEDGAAFVTQPEEERAAGGQPHSAGDQPIPAAPPVRLGVLVADANAPQRARTCAVLTDAGYRVDTAPDGPSAVARLAIQAPDALITAASLPLMSGADLIRYVRANAGLASLPVIAVHGDQQRDHRPERGPAGWRTTRRVPSTRAGRRRATSDDHTHTAARSSSMC